MTQTVYVNDYIGETEVYHSRRGHATHMQGWTDRYVRETTVVAAQEEGLRPCKVCFPVDRGKACPGCGREGLSLGAEIKGEEDKLFCEADGCRVVSFREGDHDG